MLRVWRRGDVHTCFGWGNLRESDHLDVTHIGTTYPIFILKLVTKF
jgi:hypothetical protein